jgi:hypothetical protein
VVALALAASDLGADEAPAERAARAKVHAEREKSDRAAFDARVNEALVRGVAWLRGQQLPDGSYPGFGEHLKPREYSPLDVGLNALVMLTLAHGGVKADDDAVKKCLRWCQFHYAGGNGSMNLKGNGKVMVYTAATLVLALDALHRGVEGGAPSVVRDRYGHPTPAKPQRCKYPDQVRKWIVELVEFLVGCQHASGGWRYPGNTIDSEDGETDLSNTQYALLALDAAARCGIPVPESTWTRAAEHVLGEQEAEGLETPVWVLDETWIPGDPEEQRFAKVGTAQQRGWCYLPGGATPPTGSMTAAGVTSLALAKERLWALDKLPGTLRQRIDCGLLDGAAWLGEHFLVTDNPEPPSQWHHYYLHGLERMGTKLGLVHVGRHDWYREGGEHLLASQQKDGGWLSAEAAGKPADHTESAVTQTCFAILFLKRSTPAPSVPLTPPVLTGGGGAAGDGR